MDRNICKQFVNNYFGDSNYITINKSLLSFFDGDFITTAVLEIFISKRKYFEKNDQLTGDGYFYYTQEKIKENICAKNISKVHRAVDILSEKAIVITVKKGLPARIYYKIDDVKLCELLNLFDIHGQK